MFSTKSIAKLAAGLTLLLGIFVAPLTSAQDMALGDSGEIYRLLAGDQAELFPSYKGPSSSVLALEISYQDGARERLLVPATDRANDTEAVAALFYEEASKTVFLVWDSRINHIHSVLNLVSYNQDGWSDVIQVRGGWLTPRTAPRIAVTRDRHIRTSGNTASQEVQRTYIHLLWWEGPDSGDEILYTPILLENGQYIDNHPVTRLGDLIGTQDLDYGTAVSNALAQSPSISLGVDGEALIVGFVDFASGALHFLEIRPASGGLSNLAGGIGHRLVEIGYATSWRDDQLGFATSVRQEFNRVGRNLHPGIRSFLARELFQLLMAASVEETSLEELATRAQDLLVESSADMLSGRLSSLAGGAAHRIIDIGFRSVGEAPDSGYFLTSRSIRSLAAPVTPEAPTSLYLSSTGSDAIVAWEEEGMLRYVETGTDGWSAPATLTLDPDLSLDMLHQILRQRIARR